MKNRKYEYISLGLTFALLLSIIPLLYLTKFYYKNQPSKFNEKHLDSAVIVYRYIQPANYFEDSLFPSSAFNHQQVDSTIKRLFVEKKVIKLLKETLYSLNIIDGAIDEQFSYSYSGRDTLILSVSCKVLDYNRLLRTASNDENFKVYLVPNPNTPNFELLVQNTLVFQFLINHKPFYLNRNFKLYFTLKDNKLVNEKIITNY